MTANNAIPDPRKGKDLAPTGYTVETGTACLAKRDCWCRLLRGHDGDHDFGPDSAPRRSADLPPGTRVRYKPTGDVRVLGRRKKRHEYLNLPGWWLDPPTAGGLADIVIDEPRDDGWEVLDD